MHKKIAPFFDINNPIINEFKSRYHIDDCMLVFDMILHGIVMIGHVDE